MRAMFRGFKAIAYKEAIHIVRDSRTLILMLVIPGLQLTIFGYAIELEVKDIPTVVLNRDGRPASRELVDRFTNSGYFRLVGRVVSDEDLNRFIVRGEAKVGLKIPSDYSDRLLLGRAASIQILIDGSDSTIASQALNVANGIALRESLSLLAETTDRAASLPIDARPRILFNPDMRTARFMVPGLVGIVMQLVTMFLTAFAIVREKENGTLEQVMATPVSRLGLMLGKLLPYCIIGAFETTVVLTLMRVVFQVPIIGSMLLLAAFSVVFLFTALGLGLMISTVAKTQVEAIQWAFLIMLPSVLLSGFIFPQESMPTPIYVVGQAIPVTYFIAILRGIILRGAGFFDLWHNAAWLAGIGFVLLTISARRFRKTLS
ncbi:MAG: transport permease protein [Candidatus Hydrogenedentota bacterium]